jgi:hypothetical protein
MTTKLIDAGLDYIRATANGDGSRAKLNGPAYAVFAHDQALGYAIHSAGMIGFYGQKSRHCFIGTREDWSMLQVTGEQCREHWNALLNDCDHVTRIDLQVTVQVEPGTVAATIQKAHDDSIACKSPNGKKWKTKGVSEDGKMQTVYVGKRASEWYGRIYDKYAESKKSQYKDCVRYEIELKGKAAQEVWEQVRRRGGPGMMGKIVCEWFAAHGVDIGIGEIPAYSYVKGPAEAHRDDKALGWLARCVSGTVARLCATGHWFPAFNALFKEALTDVERAGILLSAALIEV